MKKIMALFLVVFFILLSPISAYASTTESMMMYSMRSGDEYSVMPLAISSNLTSLAVGAGYYDLQTDNCYFNYNNLSISSNNISGVLDVHYFLSKSNNYLPAYSFKFSGSKLGEVDSLVRVYSSLYDPRIYVGSESFNLSPDLFSPFKVFAKYHITATAQSGNNHFGVYVDNVSDVTNFFMQNSDRTGDFDIDASVFIESPTEWYSSISNTLGVPDRIYNSSVTELELIIVCPYGSFQSFSDSSLLSSEPLGSELNILCWFGSASNNFAFVNYDTSSSSNGMLNAGFSSIQNSVNQVSTNVTNQVNQVKTQISQSTNTITTKIDTMANDVKSGLQNVVTSAQQNTQNIINTVTQKVDQVKETVTEVKDSILDLPNKIQEMLLGLIVPDSDTMADKYSEFSGLLEEKLGVIYQIPMMLFDFFDTIVNAATTPQSTLTLPAFRLPWIDGSQLTIWNSMEYKIIPDGLEVLSDLIRTVTSMTVVVLTFNSVKQAYERFLRS